MFQCRVAPVLLQCPNAYENVRIRVYSGTAEVCTAPSPRGIPRKKSSYSNYRTGDDRGLPAKFMEISSEVLSPVEKFKSLQSTEKIISYEEHLKHFQEVDWEALGLAEGKDGNNIRR